MKPFSCDDTCNASPLRTVPAFSNVPQPPPCRFVEAFPITHTTAGVGGRAANPTGPRWKRTVGPDALHPFLSVWPWSYLMGSIHGVSAAEQRDPPSSPTSATHCVAFSNHFASLGLSFLTVNEGNRNVITFNLQLRFARRTYHLPRFV